MRARAFVLVPALVLALLPATQGGAPRPARSEAAPPRSKVVIVAAGDIACDAEPRTTGDSCRYGDTAALIDGHRVDAVLALGDEQYDVGAYSAFVDHFDPTWGAAAGRIRPVPGNHEYAQDPSSSASGYFRYFGDGVRGPDGQGYYSYELGACPDEPCWHVIALNSMLCLTDAGCDRPADRSSAGRGEAMWQWLRRDLARHPNGEYACTLAYWHHPLYSFSSESGATSVVRPLWELLERANADVVLNGHSHNYQRWAPQTADGDRDPGGIREFVVGTGGASHYEMSNASRPAALAATNDDAFGVLRLALESGGYAWRFVPVPGEPAFEDASSGTVPCH